MHPVCRHLREKKECPIAELAEPVADVCEQTRNGDMPFMNPTGGTE
jgi:hypothetical protein